MVAPSLARTTQDSPHQVVDDSNKNPNALFKMIEETAWEEAHDHCKEVPEDASKWIVRRDTNNEINWRRLPLHEACMRDPTETLVQALLEAYPSGAEAKDHNGRLPLHHACVYGASREVIETLLLAYPDSVEEKDNWGKSPRNVVEGSSCVDRPDIVELVSHTPSHYETKRRWIQSETEEKERSAQLDSDEAEKDAYVARIQTLEKQVDTDKEMIRTMTAMTEEFEVKVTEMEGKVHAEKRSLEERIATMEETIASLESENEGAHIRYANLEKELQAKMISEVSMQETIDQLAAAHKSVEGPTEDNSELQAKIDDLTSKLKSAEDDNASLMQKVVANVTGVADADPALKATVQDLASKLEEAKESNANLENEIESRRAAADSLNEQLVIKIESERSLQSKVETLQKKIDLADLSYNEYQKAAIAAKSEASCLVEILQGTLSSESTLKVEVESLTEQLEEAQKSIADLNTLHKEEKKEYQLEIESLKSNVSQATSSQAIMDERAEQDLVKISELETKLNQAIEGAKAASAAHSQEKQDLEQRIEALEAESREKANELKEVKNKAHEKLNEERGKLLSGHNQEKDELMETIASLTAAHNQEKEEMMDKIESLVDKVLSLKQEMTAESTVLAQTREDLEQAQRRNKKLVERAMEVENTLLVLENNSSVLVEERENTIRDMQRALGSYKSEAANYKRMLLDAMSKQKRALESYVSDYERMTMEVVTMQGNALESYSADIAQMIGGHDGSSDDASVDDGDSTKDDISKENVGEAYEQSVLDDVSEGNAVGSSDAVLTNSCSDDDVATSALNVVADAADTAAIPGDTYVTTCESDVVSKSTVNEVMVEDDPTKDISEVIGTGSGSVEAVPETFLL